MWTTLITLVLQYTVPEILAFVAAHQKANSGAMPSADQVIASTPSLQILAQGAAWEAANPAKGA
jgi:hypothetical protein